MGLEHWPPHKGTVQTHRQSAHAHTHNLEGCALPAGSTAVMCTHKHRLARKAHQSPVCHANAECSPPPSVDRFVHTFWVLIPILA